MTNDEAAKTLGILRTFIAERLRLEERLETANRGTGIRTQTAAQEEALRLAIAALSAPSREPDVWRLNKEQSQQFAESVLAAMEEPHDKG